MLLCYTKWVTISRIGLYLIISARVSVSEEILDNLFEFQSPMTLVLCWPVCAMLVYATVRQTPRAVK